MDGLQLLHNPEWGNDSTVFRLGDRAIKVYNTTKITRDELVKYHEIHSSFSGENFNYDIEREIEFWNGGRKQKGKISRIVTSVLSFPDDAIRISGGQLISVIPYIDGSTALDFLGLFHNGNEGWYSSIERILQERLGTHQIHPRNIKISDIENETIHCTITDLACSIRGLLTGN